MKKLLIVLLTFTIICPKSAEAQDEPTLLSINAALGVPHYGIKSLNSEPMATYSILWHEPAYDMFFMGVGFEYNSAFRYKVDTFSQIKNLHVAQLMFGFSIPNTWNRYISGPAVLFEAGAGFKYEGDIDPSIPLKFAIALQQNANLSDVDFLDGLKFGFFARGTLGMFLYKEQGLDPSKKLENNPFGTLEAGIKIIIAKK